MSSITNRRTRFSRVGFTLIEIMVSLTLLGIVVARYSTPLSANSDSMLVQLISSKCAITFARRETFSQWNCVASLPPYPAR